MFTLFTAIVFLQLNGALYDSIGDYSADFDLALQLPFQNESINIGESAFNQLFWNSYHHIIKRECASCLATHRVIYYKRNTKTHSFNAYVLMTRWFSVDNRLDLGDFDLFSSLSDAFNQTNEWKYCFNNGDGIAGAFRDCGPNARVYNQWASTDPTASGKPSNFFIYIPADTPVTDTTSNTPTFSPIAVSTKEQSAVTMLITNDESGRNPYENAKDDTLIYAYLAIALCVVCCICGSVYSAKRFWKHKQSTKPQAKALSVQSEEEIVANNIDSNNDDTVNKQRQSVDNASTDDVQNTVIPVNDDPTPRVDGFAGDRNDKSGEHKRVLKSWFTDIELSEYYNVFIENGYESLAFVKEIKDKSELKEMGIVRVGHIVHIMNAIKRLNEFENDCDMDVDGIKLRPPDRHDTVTEAEYTIEGEGPLAS